MPVWDLPVWMMVSFDLDIANGRSWAVASRKFLWPRPVLGFQTGAGVWIGFASSAMMSDFCVAVSQVATRRAPTEVRGEAAETHVARGVWRTPPRNKNR